MHIDEGVFDGLRVTGAHGDLHQVQGVASVLLQQQRAVEDVVRGLQTESPKVNKLKEVI